MRLNRLIELSSPGISPPDYTRPLRMSGGGRGAMDRARLRIKSRLWMKALRGRKVWRIGLRVGFVAGLMQTIFAPGHPLAAFSLSTIASVIVSSAVFVQMEMAQMLYWLN